MTIVSRLAGVLTLAGLSLLICSCGTDRKPVYSTHGRVVDAAGMPVAGATVIFHPIDVPNDSRHKPASTTDAEGNFVLTTYQENDGAPAGEYAVTLEWRPVRKGPKEPEQPDRLEGKFRDAKTSPFKAVVKPGTNDLPPFQLP
jgi:hypothetical protein